MAIVLCFLSLMLDVDSSRLNARINEHLVSSAPVVQNTNDIIQSTDIDDILKYLYAERDEDFRAEQTKNRQIAETTRFTQTTDNVSRDHALQERLQTPDVYNSSSISIEAHNKHSQYETVYQETALTPTISSLFEEGIIANSDGVNQSLTKQESTLSQDSSAYYYNTYTQVYAEYTPLEPAYEESTQVTEKSARLTSYPPVYANSTDQHMPLQQRKQIKSVSNCYNIPTQIYDNSSDQNMLSQKNTPVIANSNYYDICSQVYDNSLQQQLVYQEKTDFSGNNNYNDICPQVYDEGLQQQTVYQEKTDFSGNNNYNDICPQVYDEGLQQQTVYQEKTDFVGNNNYNDICPQVYDEGVQQQTAYQESTLVSTELNYYDFCKQAYTDDLQKETVYQESTLPLDTSNNLDICARVYEDNRTLESPPRLSILTSDKKKYFEIGGTIPVMIQKKVGYQQKRHNNYVKSKYKQADPYKNPKPAKTNQPNLDLLPLDMQYFEVTYQGKFEDHLLDFLKNIFYYRLNLAKKLEILEKVSFSGRQVSQTPQNKLLFGFIKVLLEFAMNPGKLKKTDGAVYNLINKVEVEASRKMLIELIVDPNTLQVNEDYNTIKRHNINYSNGIKQVLKATNYNIVCSFFKELIGKDTMMSKYYDMFVSVFIPLYKISLFYDTHMKGIFEKHLKSPVFPISNLNINYSVANSHLIFYWAVEWMYFFFNFSNIYPFFNENFNIFTSIEKLPKDFFITLLLLLYFADKHEAGTILPEDYTDEHKKLKTHIEYVFYHPNLFSSTSYGLVLRDFFTVIQNTHNRKLYNYGSTNSIWLLRTTTEHIQCAIPLEYPLKQIFKEFHSMIQEVNTITKCCKQ